MIINRENITFVTNVRIQGQQGNKELGEIYSEMAVDYVLNEYPDLLGETLTQPLEVILCQGIKSSIGRRGNKIILRIGDRMK